MRAEAEEENHRKIRPHSVPFAQRKKEKQRNRAHRVIKQQQHSSNHNNNTASAAQSVRLYPHSQCTLYVGVCASETASGQTKMAHDMRTEPLTWTWNCFIVALVGCSIYVTSDVDVDVNSKSNVGNRQIQNAERESAGEKRAKIAGEQCDVTWEREWVSFGQQQVCMYVCMFVVCVEVNENKTEREWESGQKALSHTCTAFAWAT